METYAKYSGVLIRLSDDIPNADDLPLSAMVFAHFLLYIMAYPDCVCGRYLALLKTIKNRRNLFVESDTFLTCFVDRHFTNSGCGHWYDSCCTLV